MSTTEKTIDISPLMMTELQQAAEDAMKGVRNPEAMRLAAEKTDRAREASYRRIGLVDFAVTTIRALRDGEEDTYNDLRPAPGSDKLDRGGTDNGDR